MQIDERLGHHVILSSHSEHSRTPKSRHFSLRMVHDDVEPATNESCDAYHSESLELHDEWIRDIWTHQCSDSAFIYWKRTFITGGFWGWCDLQERNFCTTVLLHLRTRFHFDDSWQQLICIILIKIPKGGSMKLLRSYRGLPIPNIWHEVFTSECSW